MHRITDIVTARYLVHTSERVKHGILVQTHRILIDVVKTYEILIDIIKTPGILINEKDTRSTASYPDT